MKSKVNEYGDKIDKAVICQGVLLFLGVLGMLLCACTRGCQEHRKHKAQNQEKAKVIQIQNQR